MTGCCERKVHDGWLKCYEVFYFEQLFAVGPWHEDIMLNPCIISHAIYESCVYLTVCYGFVMVKLSRDFILFILLC